MADALVWSADGALVSSSSGSKDAAAALQTGLSLCNLENVEMYKARWTYSDLVCCKLCAQTGEYCVIADLALHLDIAVS